MIDRVNSIEILLNNLTVTGIENCKRIVMIDQILKDIKKEAENGNNKKDR